MRSSLKSALLVSVLALVVGVACSNKVASRPTKPVPVGTVLFRFTRKVQGPVELTLDGVRIPVEPLKKGKKAQSLVLTGITTGKHRFFLYSPRDAFGPDQGEFEATGTQGLYLVTFAQSFNAVLYGQAEALPPAAGVPGVKARLE
jgi:hypothetical protein